MSAPAEVEPVVAPVDRPGPPQGAWTYADYCALPDDGHRYEVVDGVLYMTPSPKEAHQAISAVLMGHLMNHVQFAGRGRVYAAPFDVRLGPGNVVQPDIIVVLTANLGIITPDNIVGAPDLVIEIASPSTTGYDRRQKQDAYAAAEVGEYWLVDPAARTIEVLQLAGDAYRSLGAFRGGAQLPSSVVPDLPVPVAAFFA